MAKHQAVNVKARDRNNCIPIVSLLNIRKSVELMDVRGSVCFCSIQPSIGPGQ